MFFLGYPDIFDSDLKIFFENIAPEEKKNISVASYFQEKLQHRLKRLLVFL